METQVIEAIIPTLVVPFAFIGFVLSAIAAFIASLFGITLKTEGPRRLLEVLLKPKVITWALITNAIFWGGYQGYLYWKNSPTPVFWIKQKNKNNALDKPRSYENVTHRFENKKNWIPNNSIITGFEIDWERKFEGGFFNQVTASGDSLFIGSKDGLIYELDQNSNTILRNFNTGTHVTPASIIWNGFLFSGEGVHDTHSARIYKFSLKTGELLGQFATTGHTEGTPHIAEYNGKAILLATGGKGGAYGIDPNTMKLLWNHPVGHSDSGFGVFEDVAYFVTGVEKGKSDDLARHIYAVNIFTGEILWKKQTSVSGWMPPKIIGSQVCLGLGELYWSSDFGQFACFDRKNGERLWSVDHERPIASLIATRGNYLSFADLDGTVCMLDAEKRKKLWCQKTRETTNKLDRSYSSPVFVNDKLIAMATKKEGIHVFDVESGERVIEWKPENWGPVYARLNLQPSGWFINSYGGQVLKITPTVKTQ